jgi:glycosyltransferase involved in cell wall biosynthesis
VNVPFPAFIYVPFYSAALPLLSNQELEGSQPLLQRVVKWFSESYPGGTLRVLCNTADSTVSGLADGSGWELIRTGETSHLAALLNAAECLNAGTIVVLPLACAYAPVSLLPDACAHHLRTQNKFTLAADWPRDAAPEIYEAEFLFEIQPYALPEFGSSIAKVALTYIEAVNASAERGSAITYVPFFPRRLYGAGDGDLPEAVDCVSVDGTRLASKIPLSSSSDADPLSRLKQWRDTVIDKRLEELALFARVRSRWPMGHDEESTPTILFVSSVAGFSGGEEALIRTIAEIDRKRYSVCALIGAEGFLARRLREVGAKVICAEREFTVPSVVSTMYLMRIISDLHPAIIHSNCRAGAPLILAASLLNVPFVQHVRVCENSGWGDSVLNARAVVCVSEKVRRFILRLNVEKERLRVIYDGIDMSAFAPGFMGCREARAILGLPVDKRIVLMVARFEAFKQHTFLIDAFQHVHEAMPDTLLVIVGESNAKTAPVYRQFMERMMQLGLENATLCVGFQPDIRPIMCAANIVVSTSRHEPFGLTILEALALGRPVLATDSCGAGELLRKINLSRVLARDNSTRGFAQQLINILQDYENVCRMNAGAYSCLLEEASVRRRTLELMSLYDELVSEKVVRNPEV